MAFISMVFVCIFLCILFVGFCGLVLILIGIIKKVRNKKIKSQSKSPLVLMILGGILVFPIAAILIIGCIATVHASVQNDGLLGYQVKRGSVEDVERLLKQGVNPECERESMDENTVAREGEYTLLCYLSYSDEVSQCAEKMQMLIDYGADVNWKIHWCEFAPEEHGGIEYEKDRTYNDSCGETPLMMASGAGNEEAVRVLLENGAEVNAQDYCGSTALIYACKPNGSSSGQAAQVEIVRLLLESGADRYVCSIYDGTALENAQERDMQEVVNLLVEN